MVRKICQTQLPIFFGAIIMILGCTEPSNGKVSQKSNFSKKAFSLPAITNFDSTLHHDQMKIFRSKAEVINELSNLTGFEENAVDLNWNFSYGENQPTKQWAITIGEDTLFKSISLPDRNEYIQVKGFSFIFGKLIQNFDESNDYEVYKELDYRNFPIFYEVIESKYYEYVIELTTSGCMGRGCDPYYILIPKE